MSDSIEQRRLDDATKPWKQWGPYLSERAWGTVREDYSANGDAWNYFSHDHARSRAYRWNEDGLAGISDDNQWLCFAPVLWNGKDPILKERLFGLTGPEGNHGEDVKEYYFYLDSTPTHSYMKMLYKYPQDAFPYDDLVSKNRSRGKLELEYELIDTGVFKDNRYFDIIVEYAKESPEDILIQIEAHNRGPDESPLHILPTLWFRNNWIWGRPSNEFYLQPAIEAMHVVGDHQTMHASHHILGDYFLDCEHHNGIPRLLFTDNETNRVKLFKQPNDSDFVKDAFDDYVVHGREDAINPGLRGTKAAAHYVVKVPANGKVVIRLRLYKAKSANPKAFDDFDVLFASRRNEADQFYLALQPKNLPDDLRLVQRQALAGMLWSKQFYNYNVTRWLDGDPKQPAPPRERSRARNSEWRHFNAHDIISMPDKWEYPWFAAWDLAFHTIALALVDPDFAKDQLKLLGQEWFQHPNGQISAYEWNFGDVNPPVLAWATWRVFLIDKKKRGEGDRRFLEFMFHKLALNFTWWVNRKDSGGRNLFQGGFLGLDNIGLFDRSMPLPDGLRLDQSDGTSWMAMFCLDMVTIAKELGEENKAFGDILAKYAYHFMYIVAAMEHMAGDYISPWNREDKFFYDVLSKEGTGSMHLKIRSMVGLIPIFATSCLTRQMMTRSQEVRERLRWFVRTRPVLADVFEDWTEVGQDGTHLLALCRGEKLVAVLERMLDEKEFLSAFGIRALSRVHEEQPYVLTSPKAGTMTVKYMPAESDSGMFGGNSNWRGPIWMPVNYLIIESLRDYGDYYGETLKVEFPTGSGKKLNLHQVADELSKRLINIFAKDENGRRAVFGEEPTFQNDPHWKDLIPFFEYFHGDNGRGVGASHQTGWTGLIASLIQELHTR